METYDLVSHGGRGYECNGTYDGTAELGYGGGYVNSCIHSGSTEHSGGDTVWYNYAIASAGTIVNKDATDTTGNVDIATESICPKGWALPIKSQLDNQRNVTNFSPVLGGFYYNAIFDDTRGTWWSGEAYLTARRYSLSYDANNLVTVRSSRRDGIYIRCVSEEKTVTDLTYMQDMTPSIASFGGVWRIWRGGFCPREHLLECRYRHGEAQAQ